MKILQLSPKVPYPLTDGGAVGIFNLTKQFSLLGHDVTLLCFGGNGEKGFDELRKYARLETVPRVNRNSIFGAFGTLLSPIPYTIGKYHTATMSARVSDLIASESFDLVHVDHLHMAHYGVRAKEKFRIPIILRAHNFETAIWERLSQRVTNPLLSWYSQNQLEKIRSYEARMAEKFDCCVMMSSEDEARLRRASPRATTAVIPAGVDTTYFRWRPAASEEPQSILFLGSLDWLPNEDGFWWFYKSIFPKVVATFPTVKLYVVGKHPPARLRRLSHPNLVVVGLVDDVRPYLKRCQVCVVPLRIGSGMRIKILEMLSMEKAIVSTSIGCEGIEVERGKELIIADDENLFAERVCQLLRDPSRRNSLGEAGRSLVCQKYRWEDVVKKLVSLYESVLQQKQIAVQP